MVSNMTNLVSSVDAPNVGALLTGPVHLAHRSRITLAGGQGLLPRGAVVYQDPGVDADGLCKLAAAAQFAGVPAGTVSGAVAGSVATTITGTVTNTLIYDEEDPPAIVGVESEFDGEGTSVLDAEIDGLPITTAAGAVPLLFVLEEATETGSAAAPVNAVASGFDAGHFNAAALKFATGTTLNAAIAHALRTQGIHLDYVQP